MISESDAETAVESVLRKHGRMTAAAIMACSVKDGLVPPGHFGSREPSMRDFDRMVDAIGVLQNSGRVVREEEGPEGDVTIFFRLSGA